MKRRVLHVVPLAPGGGTSSFTQRQIDRLTESGIEGRLIFVAGSAMMTKPHRLVGAIKSIRNEINSFRPDLVHAHWGSLLAFASAVASIGGPPLIVSFRGSDINPVPSEHALKFIVRQVCSQSAALRAAGIICMSEELKGRLLTGRNRTRVILDGTDINHFSPLDRTEARRLLGWPEKDKIIFFYAGTSPRVKRYDLAAASVAQAQQIVGPIRFEVMRSDVPFDQVPLRMNAANCLLMTSDYEGSPNVVREALSCNTPIVSVPVGDVRRWLTGLEGTRIVERDPVMLGQALAEIITADIRPNGRSLVDQFSEESSCRSIIDVYETVLGRVVYEIKKNPTSFTNTTDGL